MRVVILAGGKGSRLRPFTTTIPKPLVPVGDHPIIEVLIRQLARQGFADITVSVGYLAPLIQAYCADGSQWGVHIDYVAEDAPLGTIGALSLVTARHQDEVFLLVNGDTLTDLDMGVVARDHDLNEAMTICASQREVSIDFGVLETDQEHRLIGYQEKPNLSYAVAMGINVVSSWAVRRWVLPGQRMDVPDFVRILLREGQTVRVRSTEAYWRDLGRIEDLELGTQDVLADPVRFLAE